MKILWITLESILPANTGGRIGVFKRLEQLSKTEDIYLFYPYDNEKELAQVEKLKKYCKKVYPYNRQNNKKHALLNLWKYPYTVGSREFSEMRRNIKQCVEEENIDVINIDFPHMCVNLFDSDFNTPIVLNEHNIEWKVYRTIASSHKNVLKKLAYYIDSFRLKKYEKRLIEKLNIKKVTFVSSKDMEYMVGTKIISEEQAELIPVGADVQNIVDIPHECKNIIFVGKMSYGPNVEATIWFAKEVFPQIKESIDKVKFYIIGKDPTDEVKRLQSDDIVVTGMIDDVRDYYAMADLAVLPLKNGGGVKVKLLEAISYRKPIVSTTVGVEGTYYADHFIPVADDADGFATYCSDILNHGTNYPETGIYDFFVSNYTWTNIGKRYLDMLREVECQLPTFQGKWVSAYDKRKGFIYEKSKYETPT